MKYALLIYHREQEWENASEADKQLCYEAHGRLNEVLQTRGVEYSGEELQPSFTATTLRGTGDKAMVTDGPFAETMEQLGGLYIIDVANLDEAMEYARMLTEMTVEIRAIVPHEEGC